MERERIRHRNLPHWDVPNAPYFVTTCLAGSIPAEGLLDIAEYRLNLRQKPLEKKQEREVVLWKKTFVRIEEWLDLKYANRLLERADLANTVVDSIRHFAGSRYDLFAYVVMPSHLHWLFHPKPEWAATVKGTARTPRERIVYSVNRFTAAKCNKLLGKKGPFWQKESFDHWVRDVDELERIIRFIEENPVKAGLVKSPQEWLYSSASVRVQLGLEWGLPIPGVFVR